MLTNNAPFGESAYREMVNRTIANARCDFAVLYFFISEAHRFNESRADLFDNGLLPFVDIDDQ